MELAVRRVVGDPCASANTMHSLVQVKSIPESVLANMTFQILWGLGYLKHEKRLHRVWAAVTRGL